MKLENLLGNAKKVFEKLKDSGKYLAYTSVLAGALAFGEREARANLVFNGEFTNNADGWALINHDAANWQSTPGWNGVPGNFLVNDSPGRIPETSQLIQGLEIGKTYDVSGYFKRQNQNWPNPNFQVLLNNDIHFEAGGTIADGWTPFSFNYTASQESTLLKFRTQVSGDDDYLIDNIMINAREPIKFNGHFYEVIENRLNWPDARDDANSREYLGLQGHLASVASEAENNFILENVMPSIGNAWLGGFQPDGSPEPAGNWQWVTEEDTWSYTNWNRGEPNNDPNIIGGENSLLLNGLTSSFPRTWNDLNGNSPEPYVIEYEPEPSTLLLVGAGLGILARRKD